jgi:hypothetical protein
MWKSAGDRYSPRIAATSALLGPTYGLGLCDDTGKLTRRGAPPVAPVSQTLEDIGRGSIAVMHNSVGEAPLKGPGQTVPTLIFCRRKR